jgi:hypothetical protein
LCELVAALPGEAGHEGLPPARRIAEKLHAETVAADPGAVTPEFIERMRRGLMELSDAISDRYLANRDRMAFSFRVDE